MAGDDLVAVLRGPGLQGRQDAVFPDAVAEGLKFFVIFHLEGVVFKIPAAGRCGSPVPAPSRLSASLPGAVILGQRHALIYLPVGPGRTLTLFPPGGQLPHHGVKVSENRHIRVFHPKQGRKALIFQDFLNSCPF